MVQPAHHVPRPQKIQLPAIPPSQLPQYVAPTRASKALQFSSFALAGCITAYAVLAYDFGPGEHCFMPVRRWFDDHTQGFFTLSAQDRAILAPQAHGATAGGPLAAGAVREGVVPRRETPFEFFKSGGESKQ